MDKKKFVVDEKTNCDNSQVIAKSHKEVPVVMESKHPLSVMVFLAVAGDGRIMCPHFIKAETKINTSKYVKTLKEVLMPWIKKHYYNEPAMFIQDSGSAHGSKTVQDLLLRELPFFVPKDI